MNTDSSHIISLVSCRIKVCPHNRNYQRVLTYCYSLPQTQRDCMSPKIQYLFAHGAPNAIKRLYHRIPKDDYRKPSVLDENAMSLFIWKPVGQEAHPIFTVDCARRSFCHIAQKGWINSSKTLRERRKDPQPCPEDSYVPQYFAMDICIRSLPGTIYALTCALTGSNPGPRNARLPFDFNVDHLRSTLCRTDRCVKIDLYGRYTKKKSVKAMEGLGNVEVIAFYYLSETNISEVGKMFGSPPMSEYFSEYTPSPEPPPLNKRGNIKVYRRQGLPEHYNQAEAQHSECQIARFGLCLQSPSASSPRKEGDLVKIEACIHDKPGALSELLRLIAVPRRIQEYTWGRSALGDIHEILTYFQKAC